MNENIMRAVGFGEHVDLAKAGKCPWCKAETGNLTEKDFRDAISWKEFGISGLCQKCQDNFFKSDDDE